MRGIPFFYASQANMLLDGAEMSICFRFKTPIKNPLKEGGFFEVN